MPLCPQCNEEIPLLVKVCPCCGYVVPGNEDESAEKLIGELENVLLRFKSLPRPTFIKSISQLTYIVFPILAVYLFILALMSDARIFWATGGLSAILSVYTIVRRALGKLGNDPVKAEFLLLKNAHEHLDGVLRNRYKNDKSVRQRLGEISLEIADVEAAHRRANRHNLYKWIGVGVVCVFLAAGGAFTVDKRVNDVEAETVQPLVTEEDWKEAVQMFKKTAANDEYADNTERMTFLMQLLDTDRTLLAERFFFECCQGKMGDFDCAQAIMRHYIDDAQDLEAAMKFADKVILRYGSDKERLKKMLKR